MENDRARGQLVELPAWVREFFDAMGVSWLVEITLYAADLSF